MGFEFGVGELLSFNTEKNVSENIILDKPIISIPMIEEKLNDERGKAFLAAITLLKNSDWLGSYGFGFSFD